MKFALQKEVLKALLHRLRETGFPSFCLPLPFCLVVFVVVFLFVYLFVCLNKILFFAFSDLQPILSKIYHLTCGGKSMEALYIQTLWYPDLIMAVLSHHICFRW